MNTPKKNITFRDISYKIVKSARLNSRFNVYFCESVSAFCRYAVFVTRLDGTFISNYRTSDVVSACNEYVDTLCCYA